MTKKSQFVDAIGLICGAGPAHPPNADSAHVELVDANRTRVLYERAESLEKMNPRAVEVSSRITPRKSAANEPQKKYQR
jgi:hypothetical protein